MNSHHLLGLNLNWHAWFFVLMMVIAIIVLRSTLRDRPTTYTGWRGRAHSAWYRPLSFGVLFFTAVLYLGVEWLMWSRYHFFLLAFWWFGLGFMLLGIVLSKLRFVANVLSKLAMYMVVAMLVVSWLGKLFRFDGDNLDYVGPNLLHGPHLLVKWLFVILIIMAVAGVILLVTTGRLRWLGLAVVALVLYTAVPMTFPSLKDVFNNGEQVASDITVPRYVVKPVVKHHGQTVNISVKPKGFPTGAEFRCDWNFGDDAVAHTDDCTGMRHRYKKAGLHKAWVQVTDVSPDKDILAPTVHFPVTVTGNTTSDDNTSAVKCANSWKMSTATPKNGSWVAKGVKAIKTATTKAQARHAVNVWFDKVKRNAGTLSGAAAYLDNKSVPAAKLADKHGCATRRAVGLAQETAIALAMSDVRPATAPANARNSFTRNGQVVASSQTGIRGSRKSVHVVPLMGKATDILYVCGNMTRPGKAPVKTGAPPKRFRVHKHQRTTGGGQGGPPSTHGCPPGTHMSPYDHRTCVAPKDPKQDVHRNPDVPAQVRGHGTTPVGSDPGPAQKPHDGGTGCDGPCGGSGASASPTPTASALPSPTASAAPLPTPRPTQSSDPSEPPPPAG